MRNCSCKSQPGREGKGRQRGYYRGDQKGLLCRHNFIHGLKRKSETQSAIHKLNNNKATVATAGEAK
jgi:hypothetical protein